MNSLEILSLSCNQINGSILEEIIGCRFFKYLSLSHNYSNGRVPSKIGYLNLLNTIDLSHNNITGEIPIELGSSQHLGLLDLSYNNFIRNIPNFSISIIGMNFSYNSLHGMIPTSYLKFSPYTFIGNKDLCGYMEGFPAFLPSSQQGPHNKRSIVHQIKFLVLGILPVLVILGCVFLFRSKVKKTKPDPVETKNGTCSPYGIMMEKLHMKTSLKQQRTLALDIVLEQAVMVVFKKHSCPMIKWLP